MKNLFLISFCFLLMGGSLLVAKEINRNKVVHTGFTLIYAKPNVFSKVKGVLKEGETVRVVSTKNNWAKIEKGNKVGYIVSKALIVKLQLINENIYNVLVKEKKDSEISSTKKGFSEEEELSAATKGFSEEEELSAATKGFSEEEELSAATKGFSEEEELSAATKGFSEEEELSAATKGFSEEEELSAATKGFSEEEELAAATKGFKSKKRQGFRNGINKKDNITLIFSKFYADDKRDFYKKQKKLLHRLKRVRRKK